MKFNFKPGTQFLTPSTINTKKEKKRDAKVPRFFYVPSMGTYVLGTHF